MGRNTFRPRKVLTRAMAAVALYRVDGSPEAGPAPFRDVRKRAWYAPAAGWAAETGVFRGTRDNCLDPRGEMTRELFAVLLFRYGIYRSLDRSSLLDLSAYEDWDNVITWAREPMRWCIQHGLLVGTDGDHLNPTGHVTRGEAAIMLARFLRRFPKES